MPIKKIFWVVLIFTIIVWIGVGIYYLWPTSKDNEINFVTPTGKPVFESLEGTHFIVGEFQVWEEIGDSKNRYIILTNPTTKRNYPKIKVVLESSDPYKSYQFWPGMTAFAVEKTEEEHDELGFLNDFTPEEIDKLIKKGDLVRVVFEKESLIEKFEQGSKDLEVKDLEGKTDDYLALSLIIKREEGKAAVEQELGREIKE